MFLKEGPTIHVSTLDLMNTCTQSYFYEHLQDNRLADLGKDKVTIANSLLTHRSPTNKRIYPIISGINLAKKSTHVESRIHFQVDRFDKEVPSSLKVYTTFDHYS